MLPLAKAPCSHDTPEIFHGLGCLSISVVPVSKPRPPAAIEPQRPLWPPGMVPPRPPSIVPLGDAAVLIRFESAGADDRSHWQRMAIVERLTSDPIAGVIDAAAAFDSVGVFFDPTRIESDRLISLLKHRLADIESLPSPPPRIVEIPVCYGGDHGPDLDAVAQHAGIAAAEVVRLHAAAVHRVAMVGFAPGFPYLTGLPEQLAIPRRRSPRTTVAAGTVAIAGLQTGIYPRASPGGWNCIGRTACLLFDPFREPPTLLQAGDMVRMVPIDRAAFEAQSATGVAMGGR